MLLLLLLHLLLTRVPRHDRGYAEVGRALPIRIAIVVEIVQEATVRRRARALVTVVADASGQSCGYRGGGGALALHLSTQIEVMSGFLVVLLAAGSSATAATASASASTSAATVAERGQCQSVSLPTGEASRLQQHHLARCFLGHVGSIGELIGASLEADSVDVATSLRASCAATTMPMIAVLIIAVR